MGHRTKKRRLFVSESAVSTDQLSPDKRASPPDSGNGEEK